MRVLWLCNIMLPFIAKSLGQKIVVKEGWLSGLVNKLILNQKRNNITLAICFPASDDLNMIKTDQSLFVKDKADGVDYYIFREDTVHPENYDAGMEKSLGAVLDDFKPDVLHIFGTEFPHTLACVKAFHNPPMCIWRICRWRHRRKRRFAICSKGTDCSSSRQSLKNAENMKRKRCLWLAMSQGGQTLTGR